MRMKLPWEATELLLALPDRVAVKLIKDGLCRFVTFNNVLLNFF